MRFARQDQVGAGIARTGVHELAVSEVIWRLTGPDDLAVDVGANIGYFTGLLAIRAREVVALEPNPRVIPFLAGNRLRWSATGEKIRLDFRAVSDTTGTAVLHLPSHFAANRGTATLAAAVDEAGMETYDVETVSLDEVIGGREVGMLKIDVEGHELAAFHGAGATLAAGLVRDIVFEDHERPPTPVTTLLENAGFSIFGIKETLLGSKLTPPTHAPAGWDAPTYLATRQPERAARRLATPGWQVLYPRLSHALRSYRVRSAGRVTRTAPAGR
jgi:FkbM family methyltransferase